MPNIDAPLRCQIGCILPRQSSNARRSEAEKCAPSIGDIAELADEHVELLPSLPNLQLIGGCCGTDHRHTAAICARCSS
jgi:methionine synthase I (cobalamin-dependent)